jgi:NAD(P)-dependent dehydrogenase (short-subunit alcohol dehydrogenase family)
MGSAEELASLRAECEALSAACLTFDGDVRDATTLGTRSTGPPRFGAPDVLFNNAGICAYGLAHELTKPAWDATIDITLKGLWIVARVNIKLLP